MPCTLVFFHGLERSNLLHNLAFFQVSFWDQKQVHTLDRFGGWRALSGLGLSKNNLQSAAFLVFPSVLPAIQYDYRIHGEFRYSHEVSGGEPLQTDFQVPCSW